MWKTISQLKEPFNDAVNYRAKREKEFFNKLFLRTEDLEKIYRPSIYYLMGEKGTGKTAYATYMENNSFEDTRCKLVTMTETQYKRFIEMKRKGQLSYSDYASIWRSMLLFVVSQMLVEKSKGFVHSFTGKFKKVEDALSKWNQHALNPEVESAFEALTSDSLSLSLSNKDIGGVGSEQKFQESQKTAVIRHHLLETESILKAAISDLKLAKNQILFIDGIDYRPEQIAYPEYLECIKGLGEAAWQLNSDYFSGIRDSKGKIKIVLLLRPDVFHNLNLYNSNSRIQDNTVFLSWSTTDKEYSDSPLYEACGKFLSSQQLDKCTPDQAWKHYFQPESDGEHFKRLLKISFQKPRDILTYIKLLKSIQTSKSAGNIDHFDVQLLSSPKFTRDASDYLLGEVRNYSAFYMTPNDFSAYLKFFQYLDGKSRFSLEDFRVAHSKFSAWAKGEEIKAKEYLRDPEALLQFFYDVNVIGYREDTTDEKEKFFHWSFRERSLNNFAPKVKNANSLIINPGISKALDIGKQTSTAIVTQPGRRLKPRATKNRAFKKPTGKRGKN